MIRMSGWWTLLGAADCVLQLAGCAAPARPGDPLERSGDEIAVCGQLFHTGARVVLWNDPGGYDAYRLEPRFAERPGAAAHAVAAPRARYDSLRRNIPGEALRRIVEDGMSVGELRELIDLFVIHYDACGTARRCFAVLHDQRGLSVHFLIDLDGTIYQTLDLKERAWHATRANDRSVGVELAHIGAYEDPRDPRLLEWYLEGPHGTRLVLPGTLAEEGIRTPGFVPRPARDERVAGAIQGRALHQYDFTDEQYEALARLTAALVRIFPKLPLQLPADAAGRPLPRALGDEEFRAHSGLLGHYHVSAEKVDPGPAFDWRRLLDRARELGPGPLRR